MIPSKSICLEKETLKTDSCYMSVFTPDLNLVWNQFRGWHSIILHPRVNGLQHRIWHLNWRHQIIVRLKTKTNTSLYFCRVKWCWLFHFGYKRGKELVGNAAILLETLYKNDQSKSKSSPDSEQEGKKMDPIHLWIERLMGSLHDAEQQSQCKIQPSRLWMETEVKC